MKRNAARGADDGRRSVVANAVVETRVEALLPRSLVRVDGDRRRLRLRVLSGTAECKEREYNSGQRFSDCHTRLSLKQKIAVTYEWREKGFSFKNFADPLAPSAPK